MQLKKNEGGTGNTNLSLITNSTTPGKMQTTFSNPAKHLTWKCDSPSISQTASQMPSSCSSQVLTCFVIISGHCAKEAGFFTQPSEKDLISNTRLPYSLFEGISFKTEKYPCHKRILIERKQFCLIPGEFFF